MKPDKHVIGAAGSFLAAAGLVALTWMGTERAIDAQRVENAARVTAALSNQALTFTEQINRQLLALDQTLRILVNAWESNPGRFDLQAWRTQAIVLSGLSRDMILADENGIIRQSSVTEAINQNIANQDYFQVLGQQTDPADPMFIGSATIGPIMRQWHMNVARALHAPDGAFAGVIDADYRISAITDVFSQTDLGRGAFVTLVGLNDAKLRGAVGPATIDPDASIGDTAMFAALSRTESGIWIGPSANDAVRRIHAFRHIPSRALAVVVSMNEAEAMRPATEWRRQAQIFASAISALLTGITIIMIRGAFARRRREAAMAQDRATLAAANAQLQFARAAADAKAEQLQATLAGMADGVAMIDAHMCLVEWNARFSEIAGVPADILRVGLPMEEILRAQVQCGQFGRIAHPELEVERRMARLRVAPFGVVQRQRPDGHTIELRRNRLPDGGFVTLYSDITEHKRAEEALRAAQAEAEAANAAKSKFVAVISHEIRTPLNALLNTVRLLGDSVLTPAQKSLLTMARQSGDVLFSLINDILDMSQIEAGKLSIRPSLFELRPLLESCIEMFAGQAAQRGIEMELVIADGTPPTLLTDPGRLRQVLLNLLSNAIKYANPGKVWLIAEPGEDSVTSVRVTVRDCGPVIEPGLRQRLFRPFSRLVRENEQEAAGSGLGLSICSELMSLMGGGIGCDPWVATDGQSGNAFWTTLPLGALPYRTDSAAIPLAQASHGDIMPPPPRADAFWVPRTRVLLAEDIPANQTITATLLRREGHFVDIAPNGAAAIQAVKLRPYDIVFMDIFMPGMSGQEATQIIRSLKGPVASIPIVALTASVSPEDETLFKAAGMNGQIGKPVALSDLLTALRKHVWRPQDGMPPPTPAKRETVEQPVLAEARVNELRSMLTAAKFAALVEECLLDLDHRLPALRRSLASEAPAAVTAHAHTMVGMAAAFGMIRLEARLRTVMDTARDGALPSDPGTIDEIEQELGRAGVLLREIAQIEPAAVG